MFSRANRAMNDIKRKSKPMNLIYDIGSNNGDDLPYYLMKAEKIVAIEANPVLCELIRSKFAAEINDGRLFVENCAIAVEEHNEPVSFYVHKRNHVLSRMDRPRNMDLFEEIKVTCRSVASLVRQYGRADYMKIDIEGYDVEILEYLFRHDLLPPLISVEAHNPRVFGLLVGSAAFSAYNVVEGGLVRRRYANAPVKTSKGTVTYSFPAHSAGPFGDDISTPWLTRHELIMKLGVDGFGWKDIHASALHRPAGSAYTKDTMLADLQAQVEKAKAAG
jgi:FkbM family methyltransferase